MRISSVFQAVSPVVPHMVCLASQGIAGYLILIRKLGTKKCMTVLESYLPVFKRPVFKTGRQADSLSKKT